MRLIISQAVPLTIAQFVQIMYNIVDRIYIGHLPSSSGLALTGIGLIFPIVSIVSGFTALFGNGGTPLFSMARGERDRERANKIMNNSCYMLIAGGIILTVLLFIFKRQIIFAFGASEDTYVYANEYLKIYLFGTIFTMFATGMNGFISAQGYPKMGMITVVIGALLNIALDPVFIFALDMGISGAALATLISQFVSAVWVFVFLTGKKTDIKLSFRELRFDFPICRAICALGFSNFIMFFNNALVQIVCNLTLNIYGGDLYIGIMTVLNSVREIFSIATTGIMNGAQPIISFNYGAKQNDRCKKCIKYSTLLTLAYTMLVWIIILIIPEQIIQVFNNEPDMILYGAKALRIYFFGFVFMALQFGGQSTFVALGKSKYAIFFSLLRKAIIVVPLTIILPMIGNLGVWGVFLAEPISNIIGGSASFTTMMLTVWRKLNVQTIDQGRQS